MSQQTELWSDTEPPNPTGLDPSGGTGPIPNRRRRRREEAAGPEGWKLAAGVLGATVAIAAIGLFVGAHVGSTKTPSDEFSIDVGPGLATTKHAWESTTGVFAAAEGEAFVAAPNPDGPRSMTVIDLGTTNATISATAGEMANGWGVAFRYLGPFNYWYLEAGTDFGTFNVMRVAGGDVQRVDSTSLVRLRDGMTVDIELRGPQIRVSVEGREIYRRQDDHCFGATAAGLVALGDAAVRGSWDSFASLPIAGLAEPPAPVVRLPIETTPTPSVDRLDEERAPADETPVPATSQERPG